MGVTPSFLTNLADFRVVSCGNLRPFTLTAEALERAYGPRTTLARTCERMAYCFGCAGLANRAVDIPAVLFERFIPEIPKHITGAS